MDGYIDLYLRFDSESQANSVLFSTEITEGEIEKTSRYTAIDIVGIIYKPSGNLIQSEEGAISEMLPLDGWHVNIRVTPNEDIGELEPYRISEPKTPTRAWL
jgi:hypothetical protein